MANSEQWNERLRSGPVVSVRLRSAEKPKTPKTAEEEKKQEIRRYSSGPLTVLGVAEDRILGGLVRAASAYRSRRDRSAEKRRDGAVLDFAENVARAPEKFVVQISKIPRDLIESRTHKRMRKRMRKPIVNLLRW